MTAEMTRPTRKMTSDGGAETPAREVSMTQEISTLTWDEFETRLAASIRRLGVDQYFVVSTKRSEEHTS